MATKQPYSGVSRRLIPILLIFMALVMLAMILFAIGIITGLVQY